MKPVRRNFAPFPGKLDAQLQSMAKTKGLAAAEDQALYEEQKRGIAPWQATPEGLVAEDYRHLLLDGIRSHSGIASAPSLFYDPVTDEAVTVELEKGDALVTVGPLHLELRLGSSPVREYLLYARSAYGLEVGAVSRWLVGHVKRAATREVRQGIDTPSWRALMPAAADLLWRELADRWIVQPWGIGIVFGDHVQ